MPGVNLLERRVRVRKDDASADELDSEDSADGAPSEASIAASDSEDDVNAHTISDDDDQPDNDQSASEDSSTPPSPGPATPHAALADISFGALASAAASLPSTSSRKRKRDPDATSSNKRRSPSPFHEAEERQAGKKHTKQASRTSKHAPTELSSKRAVSRKRSVVPVPSMQARDPRFTAASGRVDTQKIEKNYSFLNDYRASELADLKRQAKQAKDEREKERLKREARVMEDRERARKRQEEQKAVITEHKKTERERVRQGKQPFYLKKGEIKKQVLVKRFESMGEKKAEKAMEKRRKKKASKEKRSMPMGRRIVDTGVE